MDDPRAQIFRLAKDYVNARYDDVAPDTPEYVRWGETARYLMDVAKDAAVIMRGALPRDTPQEQDNG